MLINKITVGWVTKTNIVCRALWKIKIKHTEEFFRDGFYKITRSQLTIIYLLAILIVFQVSLINGNKN
jgi:hypothetical protein